MATEEITISELELADEVLADMTLPVDTATETRAVTLKQLRAWLGSSLPTGFIIPAVGKISDERFTLLDGKTLSRAGTYEAFCNKVVSEVQAGNWFACSEDEYAQDLSDFGQCGKFVVSNDYIRIPTITRFIGATITLSEIGKTYKESLPNFDAYIFAGDNGTELNDDIGINPSMTRNSASGAAEVVTNTKNRGFSAVGLNSTETKGFRISPSITSSTYQDGVKVQPDHTKYPYYMVISTEGQTASVEIDINKVYEDLNLKANSDLSNVASVSKTFKEQSVGWGMPDYTRGYTIPTTHGYTGTLEEDTQINITTNQNVFSDISFIILDDNGNEISRLTANSHKTGLYEAPCEVSVIANFAKGTKFKIRSVINSGDETLPKILAFPLKGAN